MLNHAKALQVTASLGHVLIEHTVQGEWYFASQKQALEKLQEISKNFIVENTKEFNVLPPSLVVWIKNYDLTPADRTRGMMGKFAHITIGRGDDGFWTLFAKPIPASILRHPQRSKRSKYPSWANPVLKKIMAGEAFRRLEDAQDALSALHEGYPKASTPGLNKIHLGVMGRNDKGEPELKKLVLRVNPDAKTPKGFVVEIKDITVNRNEKNKSVKSKKVTRVAKQTGDNPLVDDAVKGYFASMIEMKKKTKR
jgi:hypothetical protein